MNDYLCTGGGRPPRPENDACCRPEPPCPQQPVCPQQPPCQQPSQDSCDDCGCRRGFVQTLQMLMRTGLSGLVDFGAFAFVTTDLLVGSGLTAPVLADASYDNLAADLTGTFSRFPPCACDYIDVAGDVSLPDYGAPATGLTVSRLNLCDLVAVAFGVTDTAADNYLTARQLLQSLLQRPRRPGRGGDPFLPTPSLPGPYPPYPDPCDTCCCETEGSMGGTVSLLAGPLLVANATVLGSLDGVMVLANDTAQRFYLVCSADAAILQ